MAVLRDALSDIAGGEPSLVITDLPNVTSVDGSKLLLRAVQRSAGLRRVSPDQLLFDWALDRETAIDFADKVDVLSRSDHPGHQYLEIVGAEHATVQVSSGEYPDNLVP
jgi:hypothetical protein